MRKNVSHSVTETIQNCNIPWSRGSKTSLTWPGEPCHAGEHPGGGGRRLRLLLRGQRHWRSHHPWGAGAGSLSRQQTISKHIFCKAPVCRFLSSKTRLVRIQNIFVQGSKDTLAYFCRQTTKLPNLYPTKYFRAPLFVIVENILETFCSYWRIFGLNLSLNLNIMLANATLKGFI